jgi:YgiT-type zinc finger domain-containing protein
MNDSKPETRPACPRCSGNLEEGETTFTVDFGTGVVVVRNVPATICSLCGMEWLDDITTDKIEVIVKEAKKKQSVVEVMSLSA